MAFTKNTLYTGLYVSFTQIQTVMLSFLSKSYFIWCSSYQGKFSVVPILVGYLTPEREAVYGQIFSRYLSNPENFFVISSDFCHWGMLNFAVF